MPPIEIVIVLVYRYKKKLYNSMQWATTIFHDFKDHITIVSEWRDPHYTTNILSKMIRKQLQEKKTSSTSCLNQGNLIYKHKTKQFVKY